MGALLRLILGERLRGVDASEAGVVGHELGGHLDPEPEREHGAERP